MSAKLTSNVWPCRSGNADYAEYHKLEDVTKYNVSVYNVAFYKNSPNRTGTPLPPTPAKTSKSVQKRVNPKDRYLGEILKKAPFVERIFQNAINFRPRNTQVTFPIVRHSIKAKNSVYNDYHIRETNSGFARNSYGGFYTK
jgi:hypothetical protein